MKELLFNPPFVHNISKQINIFSYSISVLRDNLLMHFDIKFKHYLKQFYLILHEYVRASL